MHQGVKLPLRAPQGAARTFCDSQGKRTRGDKRKFSHASTGGKTAAAASSSEANTNPAKKHANSQKPKPKAKAAAVCTRYAMFAKPIDPVGVSFDIKAHVREIPAKVRVSSSSTRAGKGQRARPLANCMP